jgi:hypothetical protein
MSDGYLHLVVIRRLPLQMPRRIDPKTRRRIKQKTVRLSWSQFRRDTANTCGQKFF